MGRRSRRRQISNSNEASTETSESKKKMENENLDKKECQKSNGSGDEIAENMKSEARASLKRSFLDLRISFRLDSGRKYREMNFGATSNDVANIS